MARMSNKKALTFQYKDFGNGVYRPIIPIEIMHSNNSLRVEVLVDSGADKCIFWGEVGEALGIDVKSGKPYEFGGVGSSKLQGYIHKVGFNVDGVIINAEVVFSFQLSSVGLALVGQKCFFDRFVVKFDYKKRSVVLRQN